MHQHEEAAQKFPANFLSIIEQHFLSVDEESLLCVDEQFSKHLHSCMQITESTFRTHPD